MKPESIQETNSAVSDQSLFSNLGFFSKYSHVLEVCIITPKSFDDMPKILNQIAKRKSVIINLKLLSHEDSQRSIDFLSGGNFSMKGHQEKIEENIFFFTPSSINISTSNYQDSTSIEIASCNNKNELDNCNNSVLSIEDLNKFNTCFLN